MHFIIPLTYIKNQLMRKLQKFGGVLLVVAFTIILTLNTLNIVSEKDVTYLTLAYRILGLAGLLLLIPWKGLPYIIFDNKEFTSNTENRQLIEKIRFRAMLLKNLSTIILLLSIFIIGIGFYILTNPNNELLETLLITNNSDKFDFIKDFIWNTISIRLSMVFLLIFLIQILFRVFRYLIRISAYYDGIADSIELHLMNKNTDLIKILELFTPDEYDIRELKQSSISDTLLNLLKNK